MLLPDPLGPTSAANSPGDTSKDTSASAGRSAPSYRKPTARALIRAASSGSRAGDGGSTIADPSSSS